MGLSWQCGSCHAVIDAPPPQRECCPSCGTAPPAAARLQMLVVAALCCGSFAFLFASVSGITLVTKPLAAVAVVLGATACVHARREELSLAKPIGVTALGLGVLLFMGSWRDLTGARSPAPDPTRQTVVPLASPAAKMPEVWKDAKEFDAGGWVDASKGAIQQNDIRVRVASARLGRVRFKNRAANDPLTRPTRLVIELAVSSSNATNTFHFPSWYDPLPEASKPEVKLTDNQGRSYRRAAFGAGVELFGARVSGTLTPGKMMNDVLVFEASSLDGVQALNLELPAAAIGGSGALKLQIPRGMIQVGNAKGKTP